MKMQVLRAGVALAAVSTMLGGTPTRVSDFGERAAGWKRLAVAPAETGASSLTSADVSTEAFKWVAAGLGPRVLNSRNFQRVMLDHGLEALATPNDRNAAMAAAGVDALLSVRVVQSKADPGGPGRFPSANVTVEARVYERDRDAPLAVAQENGGGMSELGAMQRAVRAAVSGIFPKAGR